MMNVTKRLSAILAAMIMVFCTPLFVFAAGQTELRDDAELFTSEEETQLQAELDAFAQKKPAGLRLSILTTRAKPRTISNRLQTVIMPTNTAKLPQALYSRLI